MAPQFPTRQNVKKILQHFGVNEGVIYLNGQVLHERDDTDVELAFRQESNFFYVTGMVKAAVPFLFLLFLQQ